MVDRVSAPIRLSYLEFTTLAALITLCANILFLPSAVLDAWGPMGWWLSFGSLGVDLLATYVAVALVLRSGRRNLAMLAAGRGGWLGRLAVLGLTLLTLGSLILDSRTGTFYVVAGTLLKKTPEWVMAGVPLLISFMLATSGPARIGRLSPWMLLIALGVMALVLGLTWPNADFGLLLPLWQPRPLKVASLPFLTSLGAIRAAWLIALLVSETGKQVRIWPALVWAKVIGGTVIVVSTLFPLAVLGFWGANTTAQPFIYLISTITTYMFPIDRMEFIVRLIIVVEVTFSLAIDLWGCGQGLRAVWPRVSLSRWYFGLIVFILGLGNFIHTANRLRLVVYYIAAANLLTLPLLGLLWLAVGRRRATAGRGGGRAG